MIAFNIFSFTENTSLKENPGHINFFFICINKCFPGTFKTVEDLKTGIKAVIKRLREKYRRKSKAQKSKIDEPNQRESPPADITSDSE